MEERKILCSVDSVLLPDTISCFVLYIVLHSKFLNQKGYSFFKQAGVFVIFAVVYFYFIQVKVFFIRVSKLLE